MRTVHAPVNSNHVASIGYNVAWKLLEIKLRDGSLYEYSGVPFETYTALTRAPSIGNYLNAQIIPRYTETKTG